MPSARAPRAAAPRRRTQTAERCLLRLGVGVNYDRVRSHGVAPFGASDFCGSAVVEGQTLSASGPHGVTGEIGPVTAS